MAAIDHEQLAVVLGLIQDGVDGLVSGDPCRTAHSIVTLVQQRGWKGELVRCPRCP